MTPPILSSMPFLSPRARGFLSLCLSRTHAPVSKTTVRLQGLDRQWPAGGRRRPGRAPSDGRARRAGAALHPGCPRQGTVPGTAVGCLRAAASVGQGQCTAVYTIFVEISSNVRFFSGKAPQQWLISSNEVVPAFIAMILSVLLSVYTTELGVFVWGGGPWIVSVSSIHVPVSGKKKKNVLFTAQVCVVWFL